MSWSVDKYSVLNDKFTSASRRDSIARAVTEDNGDKRILTFLRFEHKQR